MPANNKPVIDAKAAAKARRKRRNAKRLAAAKRGAIQMHHADLKKVSLMKQALQSIEGFFGKGEQGGTYVFIHVSKVPGERYGRTYYNPVKRARRMAREHEKARKKKERQRVKAYEAYIATLPDTVYEQAA